MASGSTRIMVEKESEAASLTDNVESSSDGETDENEDMSEIRLAEDVWNQAVLSIIRKFDYHKSGSINANKFMWYVSSFVLWLTNIALQIGLVLFLLINVVQPMEARVQLPMFDVKAASQILRNPALQGHHLGGSASYQVPEDQAELILGRCKELNAKGIELVQMCMLYLWNAKMVYELSETTRFAWRVFRIRSRRETMQEMIDQHIIVCMDKRTTFTIFLAVIIPKWMVGILSWWIGSRLIVFGKSVMVVVLKGLALQFIVTIDELLMQTFGSEYTKNLFDKLKMRFKGFEMAWYTMWGGTLAKYSLSVCLTALYLFFVQGDIPRFRRACDIYDAQAHS